LTPSRKSKLTDVVLVDLDRPHVTPQHVLTSNLVFAATGANVDTVLIGGRAVVRDGRGRFRWPIAGAWPIE
jgi:5-methylthioadenosine/S-adenosylhomocysteine deaminase